MLGSAKIHWRARGPGMIAFLVVALLIGSLAGAPASASSYDGTKLDPALLGEILADPSGDYEVIVRATPPSAADTRSDQASRAGNALSASGGKAKFALGIVGGAAGTLKGTPLLALTHNPNVDYIYKDAKITPAFDPLTGASKVTTPGIVETGAPQVWSQYGVTGRGVTVAVVDSGIDGHADLAGRITAGIDFTSATPTVVAGGVGDPGGHGTHVAGLIAGDGTASGGSYTGVAPNANVVDVRVINAQGSSNTSIVLRGLQWVLNNRNTYHIRVVNLSLGATATGSYKMDPLATAAEVLTFAGLTVVVAAGNGGAGAGTITTPGTDPYVVTVGAVDDAGTPSIADDTIATFSSRGPTLYDGLAKPDVVAPGRKMTSLRVPGSTLDTLYPERRVTAPGQTVPSYFLLSGTSMAAPVVAGAAALMLERDPTLTPKKLKKRLQKTAVPLANATSFDQGAGLISALQAVASLDPGAEYTTPRVTDAFAKDMLRFITGQPIVWKSLTFNGGVDSKNITWDKITWTNITWDNITWENITWEAFTWTNITWENITWENITWESTPSLSTGSLSTTWTTVY